MYLDQLPEKIVAYDETRQTEQLRCRNWLCEECAHIRNQDSPASLSQNSKHRNGNLVRRRVNMTHKNAVPSLSCASRSQGAEVCIAGDRDPRPRQGV